MTQTLSQLEHTDAFIERHIAPSAEQQQAMLQAIGVRTLDDLTDSIVPENIRLAAPPMTGEVLTGHQALAELKGIATQNQRYKSCIGMGYTPVLTPSVILRNVLENPGWLYRLYALPA